MALQLKSPVFDDGDHMPARYTGEGDNISPSLIWSGAPTGTVEYVLICEDPDAPQKDPFVHWMLYGLSSSVTSLPEAIPPREQVELPIRADQGQNSFGSVGYEGPMPPTGHGAHRYIFKLYALDEWLDIPPGADQDALLIAMKGHVLDAAQTVGRYERPVQSKSA